MRHAITALTFASLIFVLLAFATSHNVIFGVLAIICGIGGLVSNAKYRSGS